MHTTDSIRVVRRPVLLGGLAVLATATLTLGAARPVAPSAAPADEAPARHVALAIYNSGTALVEDTRTLRLEAGEHEVAWPGIPQTIDASSVHLLHTGGDVSLLQQAYRFDLADAGRAVELLRGQPVVVFTAQGKRYEGALWSWDGGVLTLSTDTGLVMVQQTQLASMETPQPPRALSRTPTLACRLWARKGGAQDVTAAYLAGGMNWHAEYVLAVDEKMSKGTLSGAASVENTSGADFVDAAVHLIAGDVNRAPAPHASFDHLSVRAASAPMMAKGAPEQMQESGLSEYHMYTLTHPVTVRDKETRQVAMFDEAAVSTRRIFRYAPSQDARIQTQLELTNDKGNGLGMPIPAGRVRVYTPIADGGTALLGEDQIGHIAKGDTLRVTVGSPFDLGVTRDMTATKRLSDREMQQSWTTTFRNRKDEDVTIVWDEALPGGDWTISDATLQYAKKDANTVTFTVRVPAGKEVPVRYTVRWTY